VLNGKDYTIKQSDGLCDPWGAESSCEEKKINENNFSTQMEQK
jgi:hypothetical protein